MQIMWDGAPRAGEPYRLTVGDVALEGALNGEGYIETNIPPGAQRGTLVVGEGARARTYSLVLGHLDPVETVSGVQARLRNLGYACQVTGSLDDATRAALRAFQTRAGLAVTGDDDDATRSRLREAHDEG
jgi:Putative peptidoglycan binding domain